MTADTQSPSHLPVMWTQVMDGLRVLKDGRYLDGTFGRGGHARGVLGRLGPAGRLLLMDKDPDAIASAAEVFGSDPRVAIRRGSFATLADWSETEAGLDGVLFDLGADAWQFHEDDIAERILRVIRDADGRGIAVDLEPFVFFTVEKSRGLRHIGDSSPLGSSFGYRVGLL